MRKFYLSIVCIIIANMVFSQNPQGFNYQAVVRDANGAAIKDRNITIRIALQNTSGTVYFSENKTLSTNAQGVINYVVGSGTIIQGSLASVPWNTGDVLIKVDIDPLGGTNYTVLGSPTKVQSVPIAAYAASGTPGPAGQDGLSINWLGNFFNEPSNPTKNQAYYNLNLKSAFIYNGTAWDILAKDGTNGTNGTNGIDGISINWLGDFDTAPTGSRNKAYYNTNDKKSYIHDGTSWVVMTVDGKDGINGTNGQNGLSIQWLGVRGIAPDPASLNQAYYNSTDGKSYIYNGSGWDVLSQDGVDGTNGQSIHWLGDLATQPANILNDAYYNTIDKKSYIYNGSAWVTLAKDGAKGDPGPGLINKGNWVANTPYISGNYVFHRSTASSSVNSMYICQEDVTSATEPYLDGTHWVELQSIKGDQGAQGLPGTNGVSIQWLPNSSSYPSSPALNQAFYHTGLKKSFIYNGSTWQTVSVDGTNGSNGISIQWLGPLGTAPTSPTLNQAYYNTGDKKSYIWNGSGWNIIAIDGINGINGTNGQNGISIQWLGPLGSAPGSPSLNQAYYNTTDKKSYVYNGSTWSVIAQDGIPISGTVGQTLYYNGTWTPTSSITNDGTNVGIGITPTSKLDVNGGLRVRNALYDNTTTSLNAGTTDQILTSTGSGVLWKSPSSINSVTTGTGSSGQVALWTGVNSLAGLSNLSWGTSLQVNSITTTDPDAPILEVKNSEGKVVFGVYQSGVRIYVEDSPIVKGAKGGFAIGGLSGSGKAGESAIYMRVTSDSSRIYIKESAAKGAKGGFAIGGLSGSGKAILSRDLMYVAPDCTRIYVNENPTKGAKGGFAIGGLSGSGKVAPSNFIQLTPSNYFIGHESGKSMTTGLYNSFLGYQTGTASTSANNDVFLGFKAGFSNISGNSNVFIGNTAGYLNTIGSYNVYVGDSAGYTPSSANYNVMIGKSSGKLNTTGERNTFLGYYAGNKNTSGSENVFIGNQCGLNNQAATKNVFVGTRAGLNNSGGTNVFIGNNTGNVNAGNNNVFVGDSCGYSNTSGKSNVFIGTNSGRKNTSASYNLFIGTLAGYSTTSGQSNIFMGYNAGTSNTTGYQNIFLGINSGKSSTTGFNNVCLGSGTGQANTTGTSNVFMGTFCGYNNTTGNYNVFIGERAGYTNSTGIANNFIGTNTGTSNTTGSGNVFMGNSAGYKNTEGKNNIFIGSSSGYNNTIGDYNVFLGFQSGYTDTASFNTFIGYQAGYFNLSGKYNSFIGYYSGRANTSGTRNVFIGNRSGMSNTTGRSNVFIGDSVGVSNLSGSHNIFLGDFAGKSNANGSNNIYLGYQAGYSGVSNGDNVIIGNWAGNVNTADRNIFIGNYAGDHNTSGNANISIGAFAGRTNVTGYNNCYLGTYSGMNNTSNNNTFLGNSSGQNNNSGQNNVFVGSSAGTGNTGSGSIFIGYQAGATETGSNKLYIENSISTTPLIWGDFALDYAAVHGRFGINTKTPSQLMHIKGTTATNCQVLLEAGEWNSVGDYTQLTLGDGNHYIRGEYGNGLIFYTPDERGFLFDGGGNVRIGTTLNYAPLNVEKWQGLVAMFNRRNTTGQVIQFRYTDTEVGSISTNGTSTTYNTTSDRRAKENIVETRFSLQNLMNIKVKDFNFKNDPSKKIVTGFIAQELYEVFPDAVTKPEKETDLWQVDYGRVTPLLVKAIQDQEAKIKQLEEHNAALEAKVKEIESIKSELEAIKAMIKK